MVFATLVLAFALPASAAQIEAGGAFSPLALAPQPAPQDFLTQFAGLSASLTQPGGFKRIAAVDLSLGLLASLDASRPATQAALAPLAAALEKLEPQARSALLFKVSLFTSLSATAQDEVLGELAKARREAAADVAATLDSIAGAARDGKIDFETFSRLLVRYEWLNVYGPAVGKALRGAKEAQGELRSKLVENTIRPFETRAAQSVSDARAAGAPAASGLAPAAPTVKGKNVSEPPKPRSNFALRAATAVVLVPGIIGLVHAGGVVFSLFATALAGLCAAEFAGLLQKGGRPVSKWGTIAAAASIPAAAAFGLPVGLALALSVGALAAAETIRSDHSLERLANTAFAAALVGAGLAPLIAIRALAPHGEALALLVFVSAWFTDTAAYAVGKNVGHRLLAPKLSPKKTWEGALGGFAGALLAAVAFHFAAGIPWAAALAVSAIVGSLGQVSGFMNSMIKRLNGAKDSGTLLPGHGGFLDRFDTLVLSSAAVYALLLLLR